MGNDFGLTAVKFDDKRNKVGEHFEKIKKGLTETKNKLNELSGQISETKNADGSAVKVVDCVIKEASDNFEQLIAALNKLAGVANDNTTEIDHNDHASGAAGADEQDVKVVSKNIKDIIEVAKKSGVDIEETGREGQKITGTDTNAGAAIAKTSAAGDNNEVGALATKKDAAFANTGAKTCADLAAAVALRAMIKGSKFSAANADAEAVKGAAANAVNKVLRVLDEIISRTVVRELFKVGKAVNGMQYSENTAEKSEGATK